MKQVKLSTGEWLFVKIPEGKNGFFIHSERLWSDYLSEVTYCKVLPKGQWQIIGKASELSEDDWKGIVHYEYLPEERIIGYEDYAGEFVQAGSEYHLQSATASGLSLIASHNMKPETTLLLKKI